MNRIQITKICPLCENVTVLPESIAVFKVNPSTILQFISCKGCIFKYDNTLDEHRQLEKQKLLSMIASDGKHHNITCEYIDNDSMRMKMIIKLDTDTYLKLVYRTRPTSLVATQFIKYGRI